MTSAVTPDPRGQLNLDELATRSGVPARTIRFYQGEKLLPKPQRDSRDARVARYDESFLDRLRLIGELRDRGLKLPAIRDLLNQAEAPALVADWLGLDASLRGAWAPASTRLMDPAELDAWLDGTPPGTRAHLEEAGLLVRQGPGWLVPNLELADLTLSLVNQGIGIDLVLSAGAILVEHLGRAAERLIDLFVISLREGFGSGADPETLVEALRPVAGDAARLIFGQQLEHAVAGLLADTRRLKLR